MSAVLLDTHALVWAISTPERFSPATRARIDGADRRLVSSASLYEVGYKVRIGKWPAAAALAVALTDALEASGFEVIGVSSAIAWRAATLDWEHRDPFDRMILATALAQSADLVTADRAFTAPGAPGVRVVW